MPLRAMPGFRDYPPPDAGARSEVRRRMRAVARRCGFQELETPSVESLELYQMKTGGEEIGQQTWQFSDRGGRPVALVPETTPSLARVFVGRAKSEPLPVKWFTVSKLWRFEQPQSGREREFGQFNLDILGVPGVEAEADLVATTSLLLDELGARDLYRIRVNDRELAEAIGRRFGALDRPSYFRAVDRFRKLSASEFDRSLDAAGVPSERRAEARAFLIETGSGVPLAALGSALAPLGEAALGAEPAIGRLRRLGELLERLGLGDRVVFDPTVVRGLDYYTTTVIEVYDREAKFRSLAGGGRYDQLIERFGGPPTPAVGLAIGDQTVELVLRLGGRWPEGEPALDTYVVAVTPELAGSAFEWVERLRRAGLSADCDAMARSLSRQLKEADRRRARRALILGPKEAARGVVVERDLATGTQRELRPEAVLPSG